MINRQDRSIIIIYVATLIMVGALIVVLMNFNTWFLETAPVQQSGFTPTARNTIGKDDIKDEILNETKFKSLGPLLSTEEIQRLQAEEAVATEEEGGTGSSGNVRREVRKDNPFLPF